MVDDVSEPTTTGQPAGILSELVEALSIPVVSNGNVKTLADAHAALEYTGAAAVMSACGLLADPALFSATISARDRGPHHTLALAEEYLDICSTQKTGDREIRDHFFALFRHLPAMNKGSSLDGVLRRREVCTLVQFRLFLRALHSSIEGEDLEDGCLEEIVTGAKRKRKKKKHKKPRPQGGRWIF